jgi:hypothetical protein
VVDRLEGSFFLAQIELFILGIWGCISRIDGVNVRLSDSFEIILGVLIGMLDPVHLLLSGKTGGVII